MRKKSPPTLAVCLVVRNEGHLLQRCLESLAGAVDAIYVTDTGSTDETIAVAQSFGAKVANFAWIQDFSAARNDSLRNVREDWLLWVDADDCFPTGEAAKLRGLLADDACAATLRYQVDSQYTAIRALRLVRNWMGAVFEGRIHENVSDWLHRCQLEGWRVQDLDVELIHTGYTHLALPGKIARNVPLLEAEWQGLGCDGRVDRRLKIGSEVGLAYALAGRWEQAREHFRELVDEIDSQGLSGHAALQVLVNYLWVLSEMNKLPIALGTARRFSCRFSHSPGYHLHRGLVELASGDYLGSGRSFDLFPELVRAGGLDIPIPIEYTGAAYWAVRGQAYMGTSDYAAAAESFQMAVILDPERQEYVLRHQVASRMARK